jgi:hypothetical protein
MGTQMNEEKRERRVVRMSKRKRALMGIADTEPAPSSEIPAEKVNPEQESNPELEYWKGQLDRPLPQKVKQKHLLRR